MNILKNMVQVILKDHNNTMKKVMYFIPESGELICNNDVTIIKVEAQGNADVKLFRFSSKKTALKFMHSLFFSSSANSFTFRFDAESSTLK